MCIRYPKKARKIQITKIKRSNSDNIVITAATLPEGQQHREKIKLFLRFLDYLDVSIQK